MDYYHQGSGLLKIKDFLIYIRGLKMKMTLEFNVEDDNEAATVLEQMAELMRTEGAFDKAAIYHPVTKAVCGGYEIDG